MIPRCAALTAAVAILLPFPAHAELRISAWAVAVHDAPDQAAAEKWAHEQCVRPDLADLCGESFASGTLGPGISVYEVAEWPGIDGGPWVVGAGLFGERTNALAIADRLEGAGIGARLARVTQVPRVSLWASDVADRWRIWAMEAPNRSIVTAYLSRVGLSDVVIAKGAVDVIEPVGQPSLDSPFFMVIDNRMQGLDPVTGNSVEPPLPSTEETAAMQAAAMATLDGDTPGEIVWALPFAAKIAFPLPDDPSRARVLTLRLRSAGWTITQDELLTIAPPTP